VTWYDKWASYLGRKDDPSDKGFDGNGALSFGDQSVGMHGADGRSLLRDSRLKDLAFPRQSDSRLGGCH
jgi:hypothetical protein